MVSFIINFLQTIKLLFFTGESTGDAEPSRISTGDLQIPPGSFQHETVEEAQWSAQFLIDVIRRNKECEEDGLLDVGFVFVVLEF